MHRGFSFTVAGLNCWLLESKSPYMRIGIVNDIGLAREALRRVVLVIVANTRLPGRRTTVPRRLRLRVWTGPT